LISFSKAFAKINLHLEVLNKRDDGYHNILSLMAGINLFDLLKLESISIDDGPADSTHIRIINRGGLRPKLLDSIDPEKNLITIALKKYSLRTGRRIQADISVEKNIPAGAGLGGGSSDAAAALRLINDNTGLLNNHELVQLSSEIGADVPFCLTGGVAVCTGIGEILMPVETVPDMAILIVNNEIHIDTGAAYRSLNRGYGPEDKKMNERITGLISAMKTDSAEAYNEQFINDFEDYVFSRYPEIREIKESLYNRGADFSIMTGSGSTVIGLFKTHEDAEKARLEYSKKYSFVTVTGFSRFYHIKNY